MAKLNPNEFYFMIQNKLAESGYSTSIDICKRYFGAIYQVILDQLKINGKITVPMFGTFEAKERKSGERVVGNPNNDGKLQLVYVPPKLTVSFRESNTMDRIINDKDFHLNMGYKPKPNNHEIKKKYIGKSTVDLINKAHKNKQKEIEKMEMKKEKDK